MSMYSQNSPTHVFSILSSLGIYDIMQYKYVKILRGLQGKLPPSFLFANCFLLG